MTNPPTIDIKEIIGLVTAFSALRGYLSALEGDNITQEYVERLNKYYLPNLERAIEAVDFEVLDNIKEEEINEWPIENII